MKKNYFSLMFCCLAGWAVAQSVDIYQRPVQSEPSHDFDVLHYRIDLKFDGANRAFEGETIVRLKSLKDGFNNFSLNAETYTVKSVSTFQGKTLPFRHQKGQLHIQLGQSFGYGDTLSVLVAYGCEKFDVDPTPFGMAANYPLGIGFFDATDDRPFLFNAYSFPDGARHWFPCYDHPNDRATHETIITTSADHKVLANGLLQSVKNNRDGTVTYHWWQKQPHPTYLYNFASGPYEIIKDDHRGLPVNYWVYPKDVEAGRRSFHRTPEVLAFLEDYYGVKYPWDKYDQVIVPGIGGGAEATTATLIGASTLHDEKAEPDFPSHWLVAHEAAHHWWGDLVSYRDWTQTWMSESFATYSEYLYSNHLNGPDEGAFNLHEKRNAYLNEVKNQYQRPIVCNHWQYPNQNFDSHTYQKGALVLHMLRDLLGEENFRRVLKHFLTSHAYQPVDTHDFIKSIRQVTGQNLDWFFDQWIFGAGHPVLEMGYEWKNKQVVLTIKQTQDTLQSRAVFSMPANIAITTRSGVQIQTIWLNQRSQTFTLAVQDTPLLVRFDPENVLLKEWTFSKPVNELLYQAQHDGVIGRWWAIQELGNHLQEERVVPFLKTHATTDSFWVVRREALRVLGQNKAQDNESVWQSALQDPHSRVRAQAVALLGEMRQENLHGLFKELYASDVSYLVQAEAVRALGKLKTGADKAFLEGVAKEKSPRDILGTAARWALAELEK